MRKIIGFTFAEALITLGIIGVIASLTVPSLTRSTKYDSFYVSASKAHATLANAVEMLENTDGAIFAWDWTNAAQSLRNIMSVTCDTYGCHTPDGIVWSFQNISSECSGNFAYSSSNTCMNVIVDVNGETSPNLYGYDKLGFYITADGVFPMGSEKGTAACVKDGKDISMLACTYKLLNERKVSW